MDDEMTNITEMKTWTLVPLPQGKKATTYRWIFKKKLGINGATKRYKAKLVAKRCKQNARIDFEETFALVATWNTIKVVNVLTSSKCQKVHHSDVKITFLNGRLNDEVYMQQPCKYEVPRNEKLVCKMSRTLHGLKQTPLQWYQKIDRYLKKNGLHKSTFDGNMYYHHQNDKIVILILYVNDLFFTKEDVECIS